jgi:acrylyl-CoA reductase (NADPH)
MNAFRALRIHCESDRVVSRLEQITLANLTPGEVVIKVTHSGINYKDALAATGAGKILRRFPLVGGIDLAGEVVSSEVRQFETGQPVLVTGCGLSEDFDGGFAQYARVRAESVLPIPPGLNAFECMALGTAGFTAGLALYRMEQNGQSASQGEIVVTGATGGVGSLATDMLQRRGYRPVAFTGKQDRAEYLLGIGASRILLRQDVSLTKRPLEAAQWAGAIDNLGGEVLDWLLRSTKEFGNVACVGMAQSADLTTNVFPLILRGVSALGINSVVVPSDIRQLIWQRLATDFKPRHLDRIVTRVVELAELPDVFGGYLQGTNVGRTVVKVEH